MKTQIPDGEYDLDFSSLFSTLESDVFGLRYGFKPDTIDLAFPSLLYRDFPDNSSNELNEVSCYLVAESKINKRAITTDHNKDDHIYFEGRSKTSTFQSRKPTLINTNSENKSNSSNNNSMCEFLLFYDDVSKSFKVNSFDGFIKMNKSREPEKISKIITKISKNIPETPTNSQPFTESLSSSNAYVDSLIKSFAKPTLSTLKKPKSPIKIINNLSNNEPISSTKSYEKLLNGISPIRKTNSNSQVNSSIKLSSNISKTLSPSPSPSPIPISVSLPLKTSSASPSPILKVSRSGSTSSNGGIGIRKQQKSLLLRKAERAVGINKGNNYKPKIKEPIPLSESTKKKTSQLLSNVNKDLELKEFKIKQLERDRGRQIKEAGLEKTAFELTLTPPPTSSSIVNPVKKDNDRIKGKESKETKVKEVKESQSTKHSNINISRANSASPENQDLEKLESEMDIIDDNAVVSEEDDKTIKFFPKNQTVKKEVNQLKESNEFKSAENLDEDFDMNFSDWEDADAIDGPVLSDDNELTAGNSDFQLIIEDDPLKTKRENEKEMEERRLKEKEDTLKFKQELKRRETELKLQQDQSKIKLKQAKNIKILKSTTPKTSKIKKSTTSSTKTAKTSSANTKKNTKPEKTKEVDTELDKELDEELDKAFDDLLDEEDMSEEE
jgi:hypothetical protein